MKIIGHVFTYNMTCDKVVVNYPKYKCLSSIFHIQEAVVDAGFSLTIGVSAQQLDITVAAPHDFKNNTKGLMGVFNDNPIDELLPPGENAVPLSNSSTEKTIFYEFGELCMRNLYCLRS